MHPHDEPTKNLPEYLGMKVVQAGYIEDVNQDEDGHAYIKIRGLSDNVVLSRDWISRHSPDYSKQGLIGGVLVRYEDGYISWSPESAFSPNYIPITDVMSLPLPCEVRIGEDRYAKGTSLRTVLDAASRYKQEADSLRGRVRELEREKEAGGRTVRDSVEERAQGADEGGG